MKRSLMFTCALLVLFATAFAQKKNRRQPFDSSLSRKHELSVSLGFNNGPVVLGAGGFGNGPTFSLEYARVYKTCHFLRTGFRFTYNSTNSYREGMLYLPADSMGTPPNEPQNAFAFKRDGSFSNQNVYTGLFVGYEYGVGHKRFRFTFGADLHAGYLARHLYNSETQYMEDRSLNPQTGLYQYTIQYLQSGSVGGRSGNVFVALSPRVGMRVDVSKRMALALTFAPQIGFTQRVRYSEFVTGTRPPYYTHPKKAFFDSPGGELRLIFKTGKS